MTLEAIISFCKKFDFYPQQQGNKVVFTVSFGNRTQTCEAQTFLSPVDGKKVLKVSSKFGKFKDMKRERIQELLIDVGSYVYARPELDTADNTLLIAGCTLDDSANEAEIHYIINEVARAADLFEKKFFKGKDIF